MASKPATNHVGRGAAEKSLPPGTPLWKMTKQNIMALDKYFKQPPVQFGKAQRDRDPAKTLDAAVTELNKRVRVKP